MKKTLYLLVILCTILIIVSCTKAEDTDWSPPIDGLTWGMSIDDVKSFFSNEDFEISKHDSITYMSIPEYNTNYKIPMNITLSFDADMKFFQFTGICAENDIPLLKKQLQEKYKDFLSLQQLSNGTQWDSSLVVDQKNINNIMLKFEEKFDQLPEYESMRIGFEQSPLVSCKFIDTGIHKGTLNISANSLVKVDSLLASE
jgi:hypothetical protein